MNAVEIEQAISELAEQPFVADEFPYAFLEAFGNKKTTIDRLKKGSTNKSDIGGVLQTNNIHIKVCAEGEVGQTLQALKASSATAKARAKFILATDGDEFQAEDLNSGEPVACAFKEFPDHFGLFLPLAGISTVEQIRENSFDIRATSKLNKLYVELLKDNPEWTTDERRHDMNHFMARLIFCFFAEDTDIFSGTNLFTGAIEQMTERDGSNTAWVISEIFRAMNTKPGERHEADFRNWANKFPYVNGGLFSGSTETPNFSRHARSLLIHVGNLDWKKINPDIFGSMIQAVADDEERGALGMHYTSVPNILKVLNPLFLNDLREKLEEAGDNARKLLNLRNRIAKIRVFDPACGSGNFLVIAYKEMRAIEAEINKRRGEKERRTDIPLTNFRGIEIRDFSAEIARLALIIAEFQCDVLYRGQQEALKEFLPLDAMNWITCANALQLDWVELWGGGKGVKVRSDDLFQTPLDQAEIDFEHSSGETFICGNPPYLGQAWQDAEQKADLAAVFKKYKSKSAAVDYVSAWFIKAAEYNKYTDAPYAFVTTNSMWQGQQVSVLWPILKSLRAEIIFAIPSFKWKNLASHNAGVIVSVVGIEHDTNRTRILYEHSIGDDFAVREVTSINAYLVSGPEIVVRSESSPVNGLSPMLYGNQPRDGGNLCLEFSELHECREKYPDHAHWFKEYIGSAEMIRGRQRGCIWIPENEAQDALRHPFVGPRLAEVKKMRASSRAPSTQAFSDRPHRFVQIQGVAERSTIAVAKVSSERRRYIPADLRDNETIVSDLLFGIYDAPLWNFSIVSSSLHTVWISTVCGKLKTDFRYSNTLGWHTFPIPPLTEKNKADLTASAEGILLAREAHWPATISDLYDPEKMPTDVRAAHERNDEVLERIVIGRRFKNDTERLEKLFELYTKMTNTKGAA